MFLLAAKTVPAWVSSSFPIIRLVMLILMVLLSIAMVIVVMSQPSASDGMGAIGGANQQQDSFFGKNKGKTFEGTMKKVTVGIAISLVVLCILFYVSLLIFKAGM